MATLELESSGGSNYSDSFEIEEESLSASTNSETKEAVVSQLKSTLASGIGHTNKSPESIRVKGILVNSVVKDKPPVSGRLSTASYHEQIDLGRTMRSPFKMSGSSATTSASTMKSENSALGRSRYSGSKFRAAAQKVQAMQSVVSGVKSFSSSTELRDTVFNGWLASKSEKMSNERRSKEVLKRHEEQKQREKEMEMTQRSVKAIEKWNASKDVELQKKHRERTKLAKKKEEEEAEERERKKQDVENTKKWREEKTTQLVTRHRERKKKEEEERKKKEEEDMEKAQSVKEAFQVWSKRKDESVKEERRKKREELKKVESTRQQQKTMRKQESTDAFQAWKKTKDEGIKTNKTLYTYKDMNKNVHSRAWCPARSFKHDYPHEPSTAITRKSRSSSRSTSIAESYESDNYSESFEVSDDDDDGGLSTSDVSSVEERDGGGGGPVNRTGKRRTIQVCCQTLEYWCTCED